MLRSFIAQFEKRDKEGSSREKLLEENISSLTMEIVSIKKALIFAEKSLFEREIELQSAQVDSMRKEKNWIYSLHRLLSIIIHTFIIHKYAFIPNRIVSKEKKLFIYLLFFI